MFDVDKIYRFTLMNDKVKVGMVDYNLTKLLPSGEPLVIALREGTYHKVDTYIPWRAIESYKII